VPGELLALLGIALYVMPRSAVLPLSRLKNSGAINHSHSIMKHVMDATKELILKLLCVLDALLKLLE
jgi:hypothetical protein